MTEGWHVLLAHPREERRAAAGLIGHRIHVYLPEITRRCRHGRAMRERLVPMLPGYLFIPAAAEIPWARIRATPGIRVHDGRMPALMSNGHLARIPHAAMQIVMAKEGKLHKGLERLPEALRVGQEVEVIDGPLAWFHAAIADLAKLDTQGRIKAAVNIFGRLVTCEFEVSQVRAV
jgi:transcription antitermination factor NusG